MGITWGALSAVHPHKRQFSLEDKTISYKHKEDTIPFWAAIVLCGVGSVVFIALFPAFRAFKWLNQSSLREKKGMAWFAREFHIGLLGLAMAIVLTLMITDVVKNVAGRHRPDFLTRCKPKSGSTDPEWGLSDDSVCTQTDMSLMRDGMRSFPSGHTSFSFSTMVYLTFYFAGHFKLYHTSSRAIKAFFIFFPLLLAMYIGISRTNDNRHHWQDVLGGALLGTFFGWFSYRLYYPDLLSDKVGTPYDITREEKLPSRNPPFDSTGGSIEP
ncbi:hypothetical protein EV182_004163 [Spiromyces aspiralis]|uniref:Uncharacterized protein n=1 Tax=Spiromyces aspiralis TaxID=68401 RepID=A0ACC1HTF2_9FUNG|nr:hypothetical protein EV182_004163 [Spiromyces aspiralis]